MDFFQRVGNLFKGKGFASDSEARANDERRRREEEERRRREAEAARIRAEKAASAVSNKPRTVAQPGISMDMLTIPVVGSTTNPAPTPAPAPNKTLAPREIVTPQKPVAPAKMPGSPLSMGLLENIPGSRPTNVTGPNALQVKVATETGTPEEKEQRRKVRDASRDLNFNSLMGSIQSAPKDIANLPGLFPQAWGWAARQVGNEDFAKKADDVAAGWYGMIDDSVGQLKLNGQQTLNEMIDSTELEKQRSIDTIVDINGNLTEGQKWSAALSEGLGALVDPSLLATGGLAATGRLGRLGAGLADDVASQGASDVVGTVAKQAGDAADAALLARQQAEEAASAVVQAEQKAASVPEAVDVQPGTGIKSPNQAREARARAQAEVEAANNARAEAEALRAQADAEAQAALEAAKRIIEAEKAKAAEPIVTPMKPRAVAEETQEATQEAVEAVQKTAEEPAIAPEQVASEVVETNTTKLAKEADTPVAVPEKAPATYESKAVQAAQERLDYLKREFADPAQIKEAEAQLRAAKNEAKIAGTEAAPAVPVAKAEAEIPTSVELTKTGRVKAGWLKKEIDRIQTSDASPEIKKQAMQDLDASVKKAESEFAGTKKAEADAGDPGLTSTQKRARKTVAEVDAPIKAKAQAKNKSVRQEAKANGEKIAPRKDKAGGKVTGYMANEARRRGDPDARAALDNASPKTIQSHEKTYGEAIETTSKMSTRQVIDNSNKLDVKDFDYKKSAEALAYSGRLADEVARLSRKKKLSKTEKEELQSVREAQTNLYEKIAQSESDAARSVSYLGYLYKQLDPGMVTKKLVDNLKKEAKDSGGELKITAGDEGKMLARNKTLQKEFNTNTNLLNELETLQKSKNPGDARKAAQVAAKLEKSDARLDDAYKGVNDLTFEIRQRNMDEGIIKKDKWYGRNLDTYQRASMLSAPSGRIRDVLTTNVLTTGDVVAKDIVESVFGRAFNAFTGKHTIDTKVFGSRDSWKAGVKEFKNKTAQDFRGESRAPRFLTGLKKGGLTMDQRSGLTSAYGPSGQRKSLPLRYIHTSVALPTNISQIYKKNKLFSAGYDEGIRRGWSKKEASDLGKSYMTHAPAEVYDKINYATKEISGLQSKVGEKINNWFLDAERKINTSNMSPAQKKVAANSLTLGKNLTIPFVSYPLGTLKNLATRQSMTYQTVKMSQAIGKVMKGDEAAIKDVVSHAAQAATNGAKLAGAAMVLAPFLSDTDASGKGYTPPYIRIPTPGEGEDNDVYIPIGSLGPVGGQLINLWAIKHAAQQIDEGGPAAVPGAIAGYGMNLAWGIGNATGLANLATGSSPLLDVANTTLSWTRSPESADQAGIKGVTDLATDVITQFIPSVLRDVNSFIDPLTGGVRPETRVLNEDGDRDNIKSMIARIASGVPGWSQSLEDDDEGAKAPNFAERILGGTAASAPQKEAMAEERNNVAQFNKSLSGVLSDDKFRSLLDEDKQEIYDKAKSGELKSNELEELRNQFTSDDTLKKFREDGDWDAWATTQTLKKEKMLANPKTPKSEVEKLDRDIKRAGVLKKNKVSAEEYFAYNNISQSELNKMFDPEEPEFYNEELANRLMDIDQMMLAEEVTDEKDRTGLNAWTRAKYSLDAVKKSLGGGGGSGRKTIATEVGTVKGSSLRTAQAPELKARSLRRFESSIPNVAAQTAKTNLKKAITIQKGVKL